MYINLKSLQTHKYYFKSLQAILKIFLNLYKLISIVYLQAILKIFLKLYKMLKTSTNIFKSLQNVKNLYKYFLNLYKLFKMSSIMFFILQIFKNLYKKNPFLVLM